MKLNKIGEVWNTPNRLLSDFFGLLSSKNFAPMETWRNDFSSLLIHVLSRTGTQNNNFLLLFLNFETVLDELNEME